MAFALTAIIIAGGDARGQSVDLATANALFEEGKQLNAAGHFAEACARFEASMTLVSRLGVQLNLADCYARVGKVATAWVTFGEAIARAHLMADPREAIARERQQVLVPRLPRLVVALRTSAPIDGLIVIRDGSVLPSSAYSLEVPVPVDLGEHTIEVTAPGYLAWSTQITISAEGQVVTVPVPELQRVQQRPEPQRSPHPPPAVTGGPTTALGRRDASRVTWIVAGTGVVSVGLGSVLGLLARSELHEGRQGCDSSNTCTAAAAALIERSRRNGNLATVAFGVGAAALATGLVLYLRSPRDGGVRVAPVVAPSAVGVVIAGAL